MKFTKMHGLGNDYVYVNDLEERVGNPVALARVISDRHAGVGSDGLILIAPSGRADVRMEMYNADGSRAQMCGNGIRCVAKYAVEHGLAPGPVVRIETDAGTRTTTCLMDGRTVRAVRVDMGAPSLDPSFLPCTLPAERITDHPIEVGGAAFLMTCVSMGNPHAVMFVDDLGAVDLPTVGPAFERHRLFPERINAHFVHVDGPTHVTMMTWERGSGATRACGTGACAVAVAGAVTGRTARRIVATLPGGDLELDWGDDHHVLMTGPAVEVFTGVWPDATPRR